MGDASLYEGKLERKGTGRFPWGSRFGILTSSKLSFYKDEKAARKGKDPDFEVQISDVASVEKVLDKKKEARMHLSLKNGSVCIYRMKAEADVDGWMAKLAPLLAPAPDAAETTEAAAPGDVISSEAASAEDPPEKKGIISKAKTVAKKGKDVAAEAGKKVASVAATAGAAAVAAGGSAVAAASAGAAAVKEKATAVKDVGGQNIYERKLKRKYKNKLNSSANMYKYGGAAWLDNYFKDLPSGAVYNYLERPDFNAAKEKCEADIAAIVAECAGSKYNDGFDMGRMLFHDPDKAPPYDPERDFVRPVAFKHTADILGDPFLMDDTGAAPSDIVQGSMGTCFFLSSLAVLCETAASHIGKLMCGYNKDAGVFGVLFYVDGEWRSVIVDDRLPVDEKDYLIYAQSTKPGPPPPGKKPRTDMVWVALIEKAYARLYDCYFNVDGGIDRYALTDLTGGANMCFYLDGGAYKTGLTASFAAWKGTRTVERWAKTFLVYEENMRLSFHEGNIQGSGNTSILSAGDEAKGGVGIARVYSVEGTIDFMGNVRMVQVYDDGSEPITWQGHFDASSFTMRGTYDDVRLEQNLAAGLIDEHGSWELSMTAEKKSAAMNPFSTLWDLMVAYNEEGVKMSCSIEDPPGGQECTLDNGLMTGHAYGIVGVLTINGTKLVRARNPHGHGEWNGRWGDDDELFKANAEAFKPYVPGDDGTFHMEYEEWHRIFDELDVCRPVAMNAVVQKRGEFKKDVAGGTTAWHENPQYRFFPSKSGRYILQIAQPNTKLYSPHDDYPVGVGLYVVAPRGRPDTLTSTDHFIVGRIEPTEFEREKAIEIYVEKQENPYFIVPVCSKNHVDMPYVLTVNGETDFILAEPTAPTPLLYPAGGVYSGDVKVDTCRLRNVPTSADKLHVSTASLCGGSNPPSECTLTNPGAAQADLDTVNGDFSDSAFKANGATSFIFEFKEPTFFATLSVEFANLPTLPTKPADISKEPRVPQAPADGATEAEKDDYTSAMAMYQEKLEEYNTQLAAYEAEVAEVQAQIDSQRRSDPRKIVVLYERADGVMEEVAQNTFDRPSGTATVGVYPHGTDGEPMIPAGEEGPDVLFATKYEVKVVENCGADDVRFQALMLKFVKGSAILSKHYALTALDCWTEAGRTSAKERLSKQVASLGSVVTLQVDQDGTIDGNGLYCGRMFRTGGVVQADGTVDFFRTEVTVDGMFGNTTDVFKYSGKYSQETCVIAGRWDFSRGRNKPSFWLFDKPDLAVEVEGSFEYRRMDAQSEPPSSGLWVYSTETGQACLFDLHFSEDGKVYGNGGEKFASDQIQGSWDDGRVMFRSTPRNPPRSSGEEVRVPPFNFAGQYDRETGVLSGHAIRSGGDVEDQVWSKDSQQDSSVLVKPSKLIYLGSKHCTAHCTPNAAAQPMYECDTCSAESPVVVCAPCFVGCHADHEGRWLSAAAAAADSSRTCACGAGEARVVCRLDAPEPDKVTRLETLRKAVTSGCTLYEHGDLTGWEAHFEAGDYDSERFTAWGGKQKDASSLRVAEGFEVELFEKPDFTGWNAVFGPGDHNHDQLLAGGAKNDAVCSLKVRKLGDEVAAKLAVSFTDDLEGVRLSSQAMQNSLKTALKQEKKQNRKDDALDEGKEVRKKMDKASAAAKRKAKEHAAKAASQKTGVNVVVKEEEVKEEYTEYSSDDDDDDDDDAARFTVASEASTLPFAVATPRTEEARTQVAYEEGSWKDHLAAWYANVRPTVIAAAPSPVAESNFALSVLESVNLDLEKPWPSAVLVDVAEKLARRGLTAATFEEWTTSQWREVGNTADIDSAIIDALIDYSEVTVEDVIEAANALPVATLAEALQGILDEAGVDEFGKELADFTREDWDSLNNLPGDVLVALRNHFENTAVALEEEAIAENNQPDAMKALLTDLAAAHSLPWSEEFITAQATALASVGIAVVDDVGGRGLGGLGDAVDEGVVDALRTHVCGEGTHGLRAAVLAANEMLEPRKSLDVVDAYVDALKAAFGAATMHDVYNLNDDDWMKGEDLDADLNSALRALCGEPVPLRQLVGLLGVGSGDEAWEALVAAGVDSTDDILLMSEAQLDALSGVSDDVKAALKAKVLAFKRPLPEGADPNAALVRVHNAPFRLRRVTWSRNIYLVPDRPVSGSISWKVTGTSAGAFTKTRSKNPLAQSKVSWKDSMEPQEFNIGKYDRPGSVIVTFTSSKESALTAPPPLVIHEAGEGGDEPVDRSDSSLVAVVRTLRPGWSMDLVEEQVARVVEVGVHHAEDLTGLTEEQWEQVNVDEEIADALMALAERLKEPIPEEGLIVADEEWTAAGIAEADVAARISKEKASALAVLEAVRLRQEGIKALLAEAGDAVGLPCRAMIASLNVAALRSEQAENTRRAKSDAIRAFRSGAPATRRARAQSVRRSRSQSVRRARSQSVRRARSQSVRRARGQAVRRARSSAVRRARAQSVRRARSSAVRRARGAAVRRARSAAVRRARSAAVRRARSAAVRRARSSSVRRTRAKAPPRD